jgi:hypothetical protein
MALIDNVQGFLKAALQAREQVVDSVKAGLRMLNVPSLDDVKKIEQKLDEIQALLDTMRDVLDKRG